MPLDEAKQLTDEFPEDLIERNKKYELSDERQEIINELLEFGWNRRKVHPSRLV